MPCLASFFDAMSGVKKLPNFVPAISYPTSAFEPSNMLEQYSMQDELFIMHCMELVPLLV